MRVVLYAHGGSGNHGCEALVRSTMQAIGEEGNTFTIVSERPADDYLYGLDAKATIVESQQPVRTGLPGLLYRLRMKCKPNDRIYYQEVYRSLVSRVGSCDIAIAIGGDNYCYTGFTERFGVMNDQFRHHGIPIVLWGCSIDPGRITATMLADLGKYHLITARESITYETLQKHGLRHVHMIPDSAFLLDQCQSPLPQGMKAGCMVGVNVSPLVIRQEPVEGITLDNYRNLIHHVLSTTDMDVLLIPHVTWPENDDRQPLQQLYEEFSSTCRVAMVKDCGASELKGYISRCRFLVAARTHASIAGYSTGVPTLVVGYSVKAEGIARDLFGDATHHVMPISSLHHPDDLTKTFRWQQAHETEIRHRYAQYSKDYTAPLQQVRPLLQDVLNNHH